MGVAAGHQHPPGDQPRVDGAHRVGAAPGREQVEGRGGKRGHGLGQSQGRDLDVIPEGRGHREAELIAASHRDRLRLAALEPHTSIEQHPAVGLGPLGGGLLGLRTGLGRGLLGALGLGQQRRREGRHGEQDEHDDDQSAGSHASSLGARWDSNSSQQASRTAPG